MHGKIVVKKERAFMTRIRRTYELVMEEHLKENRQMLFLMGPRQVGKTTSSLEVSSERAQHFYFNWDIGEHRKLIIKGATSVAEAMGLDQLKRSTPIVVFDEIHKYRRWKTFIKGFFDHFEKKVKIVVTGSARLDIYKAGGDSLMGRYFPYRLHPLSVAELVHPTLRKTELAPKPKKIAEDKWNALITFGGFPEPFLKKKLSFYTRWKRLRTQQLFKEDLRDLTQIQELGQIQLLAEILSTQVAQTTNYSDLAGKINVSVNTIKRWMQVLRSFYYCFSLQPWSKNISRSLLKEPKIYLWDWSLVENKGARVENFIASHLLKAVHFWTDRGFGEYGLYFLRDKEQREVDFLIVKNKKPWILVEAKTADTGISKSLYHYQELTKAEYVLQVVFDLDYVDVNCFSSSKPIVVPAKTFLSQLV